MAPAQQVRQRLPYQRILQRLRRADHPPWGDRRPPDRRSWGAAPGRQSLHPLQLRQSDTGQGAILQPAGAVLDQQNPFIPAVFAIGQAIGRQGIAHQHRLHRGQPLQQHRHRRMHVHPIGDQAQSNLPTAAGFSQRARGPVVQAWHRIEGMGEHADALIKPRGGLVRGCAAVAKGHRDAELPQPLDHGSRSLQFRCQGHQGDVGFESSDPLVEGWGAGGCQMLDRMGAAAGLRQERALQVGAEQAAAVRLVLHPRLAQHRQGLAQRCDAAGHQGRCDCFDAIGPELLQQLPEPGQIAGGQLREGQSQPAVDLQVDAAGADPVARPALALIAVSIRHGVDGDDHAIAIELQAMALVQGAAEGSGQANVSDPSHQLWLSRPLRETMTVLPLFHVTTVLPRVAVVMGSDSDLPTMEPAAAILRELGVEVEVRVLSAHRTPLEMVAFAEQARERGFGVIVAGAGGAAHLPGMVAALTTLPVIGVPVQSRALSGVDSLHSIVQMPGGIPVATVAIGGGLNAGLLAAQILSIADQGLAQRLADYRSSLHDAVVAKDARLLDLGSTAYLKGMST